MINAFIIGIRGKMGSNLISCAESCGFTVTGGLDLTECENPKTFTDPQKADVPYDVIIDFSSPSVNTLEAIKFLCLKNDCPAVIATTGYGEKYRNAITDLSKSVPVFMSANFSLGVAAAKEAIKAVKKVLGNDFDIEIVEKHHKSKTDSPSGTALSLINAISDGKTVVYNRNGKRGSNEIGVSSVRGGGVIGEHEVGFYGENEVITVTHTALSRKLFALGAFKAAAFVIGKPPGLYGMDDLTAELIQTKIL